MDLPGGAPRASHAERWTERHNIEDYVAWHTKRGFTGTFEAMLGRPFVIHYYETAYVDFRR
jgi:hypothetical protein